MKSKPTIARLRWLALVSTLLCVASGSAAPPGGYWPQWRGPDRTNLSTETGLLKDWLEGGPPLVWTATGLGEGVPSISVAGGQIYVLGYRDDKEFLTAINETNGQTAWSTAVGPAVKEMSIMRWLSQRTPTVDGERVYAVTARGQLICLSAADGKERWRKDFVKEFDARIGPWGFCDFPLVDGDKLVCTPGAKFATVIALDKKTGEVLWKSAIPQGPRGTYGGLVVAEIGGTRQYIHQLETGVVGIAANDGRLLWSYEEIRSGTGNVHTAIVKGNEVFASCGWGVGAALLKLTPDEKTFKVEPIYRVKIAQALESWRGSSIHYGDFVLTTNGGCIDWKTGRLVSFERKLGTGTITFADGRIYHRSSNNKLALWEVSEKGEFVKHGEFEVPAVGNEPHWTFPVVAGGRLYIRDHDLLYCYDVREKKPRRRGPDVIFVPTPQDVVEKLLELAGVNKNDVVADLGCGDGRIPVTAAKKFGCRAIGWDIDKECVRMSLENVKEAGVQNMVRIEQADIFDVDLSGVTVATVYLGSQMNLKLVPQLEKMKPGSRVVSHAFDLPGYKADKVIEFKSSEDDIKRKLYLWTIPLKKQP